MNASAMDQTAVASAANRPELATLLPLSGSRANSIQGLAAPPPAFGATDAQWQRIYLGNDLCERLLPTPPRLRRQIEQCQARDLAISLLTPALSDTGVAALRACLALLPGGSEVVINDWGALQLLRCDFADLVPVAGRALARMVKDPRLPDARWARLYPAAVGSDAYSEFLRGFGIRRLEMDVPPFAQAGSLQVPGMALSVYTPMGCSTRGRLCRIGSLHQAPADKFAPGHDCRRECRTYLSQIERPAPAGRADLASWQSGNAMLYRHDRGMRDALQAAVSRGTVDRLVHNGFTYADSRTDQSSG